ncbi:MAG: hypothetical protein ABI859_09770 [Pseudomonadota bacterium]
MIPTSAIRPQCRLAVWSTTTQLSQLYTGFSLLARRGEIVLSQHIAAPPPVPQNLPRHLRDAHNGHLGVQLDGRFNLYFDTHDSHEIHPEALRRCDLYFKRSFAPALLSAEERAKVLPLGLSYEVYAGAFDRYELVREVRSERNFRGAASALVGYGVSTVAALAGVGRRRCSYRYLSAPPAPKMQPRVLFMTRVWDPAEIEGATSEKLEERVALNDLRAACILRLRRELGGAFVGGLQHSEFARRHYPAALLDDDTISPRNRYIEQMRAFPICIATTGLHGSIGWKMAEYTAFAKAIASEPLRYVVPGDFSDGRNYVSFTSPEACAEGVINLMDDAHRREAQMESNWQYFRSFVRPDAMVRNAINEARTRLG